MWQKNTKKGGIILEKIDIKPTTLNVTVNSLQERGIIQETTGYSRNKVFAFQKYIDLFLKLILKTT